MQSNLAEGELQLETVSVNAVAVLPAQFGSSHLCPELPG